jgi:uncharacterized DUF497 family protein
MVRLHWNIEWDEEKAEINRRKHGIAFEEAALVLADPDGDIHHLDFDDATHSDGVDRFITYGSIPDDRSKVLIISWTDR